MPKEELQHYGWEDENGKQNTIPNEKTVEQGASTTIWAAVTPELENTGGLYLDDNSIPPKKNSMEEIKSNYSGKYIKNC
jgi:hypothetical protein